MLLNSVCFSPVNLFYYRGSLSKKPRRVEEKLFVFPYSGQRGHIKKVTLEQRLKGDERVSWVILSGERAFQPEGTASAKILRYDHLECSRNSKEASVAGAEGGRE